MEKKTYYVNLGSGEISQIKFDNNHTFTIQATEDDVRLLRGKLNQMDAANFSTFFRAHIPILAYHHDQGNDDYDAGMMEAFQMIYHLGDEKTRDYIDEIGILNDRPM